MAAASEDQAAVLGHPGDRPEPMHRRPARRPLPAYLPRERVVIPGPLACPCCRGRLIKIGEDIIETLAVVPRSWKVVQTVRERLVCRACETITHVPALFHPISSGRARPELVATILRGEVRPASGVEPAERDICPRGIDLDVSTLADWAGACSAALAPLIDLIGAHVLAAQRLHGDDTTVPVLARNRDEHRAIVDLCARRSAIRRPEPTGRAIPLHARPNSGPSAAPSGRLRGDPAGGRLCRVQRALPGRASSRSNH